jgi:L-gulonolactone oxidase
MCYESIAARLTAADEEPGGGKSNVEGASIAWSIAESDRTKAPADDPRAKLQSIVRTLRKGTGTTEAAHRQWLQKQDTLSARIHRASRGNWLRHGVLEASLRLSNHVPFIQPAINSAYQKIFLSRQEETFGTPEEVFSFDCLFKQWTSEWAIEAHLALDALDLIRGMVEQNHLRVHFPVEFRFSDEDQLALSPSAGRKTCWVGIVMFRPHGCTEAPDTKRYLELFQQAMEKLGGRPHWAKTHRWRYNDVARAYGARWVQFLALRRQMDPKDIFVNDHMNRLLTQS